MANSTQLVVTIKQQLRRQGINYRQLAGALDLSESAVKQMFASGNMSLKRVDAICEVLKLELTDLVETMHANQPKMDQLNLKHEKELVEDTRLLLVAYCVVNYWTMQAIVERYQISGHECIQYLAKLDRMELIELLPGNRIRPLISKNFKWIEDGPIEKFFRSQVQGEFLADRFKGDDQARIVCNADLSPQARQQLIERMQRVEQLFEELSLREKKLPNEDKQGTTMVLAVRPWGFTAFVQLERQEAHGLMS
ncbi:MAG: helix-turn-helix transcriptional regulator [Gammaproteobacteria bacterium]|nr:helix-turn-helix transcriptional regulator [Gammaproteobacteria bacterium]